MERTKIINKIFEELDELKKKLSEDDYKKFLKRHFNLRVFLKFVNNKFLCFFLSTRFLKEVYAAVHDKNYY